MKNVMVLVFGESIFYCVFIYFCSFVVNFSFSVYLFSDFFSISTLDGSLDGSCVNTELST